MSRKISHQLVAVGGAVTLAVVGTLSYLLISSHHEALLAQVERSAYGLSETIKGSTRHAMLLNRRDDVHRIIDTIGGQEGIQGVRIFNKEGRIIYSPDKRAIGEMVDKRAEACYACHAADQALSRLPLPDRTRIFEQRGAGRSLGIINPIYNEPGCWQAACHAHAASQTVLGVLDVTMSLSEVDRELTADRRSAVLVTLGAILGLSLILWLFFQQLVGKPVQALLRATDRISAGDLEHRLEIHRNDELGRLGLSFNEMTHRLAEAQTQLFQSNKLASLGRLAAGVAHEINNPLTGVLTYSSFLLKRARDAETRDDLETVVRETKRCRDIVKGLLDFARQVPPRKSRVEINALVERALGILANQLSLTGVSVVRDLEEDLPELRADANQLLQVLINLIVNAVDALGDEGGRIEISTALDGQADHRITIRISDDGCGIPYEEQSKIFEPFYTTKGQKGTGLGLAVVWSIVDQHQGTISVRSEPGAGSTFTIRLPTCDAAPAAGEGEDHAIAV